MEKVRPSSFWLLAILLVEPGIHRSILSTSSPQCNLSINVTALNSTTNSGLSILAASFSNLISGDLPYEQVKQLLSYINQRNFKAVASTIWPMARQQAGFVVCLAIGIILAIGLPLAGVLVLCCRCFGRCGKARKEKTKHKNSYGALISCYFIFTLLWISSVSLYIQNSEFIWPKIPYARDSVIDQLNGVSKYAKGVGSQVRCMTNSTLTEIQANMYGVLEQLADDAYTEIIGTSKIDQLVDIDNATKRLIAHQLELIMELEKMKLYGIGTGQELIHLYKNIQQNLLSWNKTQPLPQQPPNFESLIKLAGEEFFAEGYADPVPSAASELLMVFEAKIIQQDIPLKVRRIKENVRNQTNILLSDDTKAMINEKVNAASGEVNSALSSVNKKIDLFSDQVHKVAQYLKLDLSDQNLNSYSWLRHALIVGAAPSLAVLFFLIFFWIFSAFSSVNCRNKESKTLHLEQGFVSKPGFSSHVAGTAAVFSGYTAFFLGAVLTVFTFLVFVVGFSVETFVCVPLFDKHDERYLDTVSNLMNEMLPHRANFSLSLYSILQKCEKDEGAYSALNLSVMPEFDVPSVDFPIPKIDPSIFREAKDLADDLEPLEAFLRTYQRNLTLYMTRLERNSSVHGLARTTEFLNSLNHSIYTNSRALALEANQILQSYNEDVNQQRISTINSTSQTIRATIQERSTIADCIDILSHIHTNVDKSIKNIEKKAQDRVRGSMQGSLAKAKHDVTQELGRCVSLYQIYLNTGNLLCQTILPHVNEMWFTLGVGVALIIPTIVVAFPLSNYFISCAYR